jgi:hypothetical protein
MLAKSSAATIKMHITIAVPPNRAVVGVKERI